MAVTITLNPDEIQYGANVGIMRSMDSIRGGFNKPSFYQKRDWNVDIEGALAEMAMAKMLNVYWDGHIKSFKNADIDGQFQIKSTNHRNGSLVFRPADKEVYTYILVITDCPHYTIVGGISGRRAVKFPLKPADSKGPEARWISQNDLTSIELICMKLGLEIHAEMGECDETEKNNS
jgi:hypothetical protein